MSELAFAHHRDQDELHRQFQGGNVLTVSSDLKERRFLPAAGNGHAV
jgi:hypothetical protein